MAARLVRAVVSVVMALIVLVAAPRLVARARDASRVAAWAWSAQEAPTVTITPRPTWTDTVTVPTSTGSLLDNPYPGPSETAQGATPVPATTPASDGAYPEASPTEAPTETPPPSLTATYEPTVAPSETPTSLPVASATLVPSQTPAPPTATASPTGEPAGTATIAEGYPAMPTTVAPTQATAMVAPSATGAEASSMSAVAATQVPTADKVALLIQTGVAEDRVAAEALASQIESSGASGLGLALAALVVGALLYVFWARRRHRRRG